MNLVEQHRLKTIQRPSNEHFQKTFAPISFAAEIAHINVTLSFGLKNASMIRVNVLLLTALHLVQAD